MRFFAVFSIKKGALSKVSRLRSRLMGLCGIKYSDLIITINRELTEICGYVFFSSQEEERVREKS